MDIQTTIGQNQPRKGRGKLIWRFLKGSKALFLLCMACSATASLAEMIIPQIIRISIDNVIGGASTENLARPVQDLIASFGGPAVLKQRNGRTGSKIGFRYFALFNYFTTDTSYQAYIPEAYQGDDPLPW